MAPDQDTVSNDTPAPKQGWFDRLKVRIGMAKDVPSDDTPAVDSSAVAETGIAENAAVAASVATPGAVVPAPMGAASEAVPPAGISVETVASDVAAVDALVQEVQTAAAVEAVAHDVAAVDALAAEVAAVGLPGSPVVEINDAPAEGDSLAHDVAAVDALAAEVAGVGTQEDGVAPVARSMPASPIAVEALAADVAAVDALAHEIAAVVSPEPVAAEPQEALAVETIVADVATVEAINAEVAVEVPAAVVVETPVTPPATTEEAATEVEAPGSWLDRFKGRIGLGLGTPQVVETEWYGQAPVDGTPEAVTIDTSIGDAEVLAAEAAAAAALIAAAEQAERDSWFDKLSDRLSQTRQGLVSRVHRLTYGRTRIDEEMLEELEEILLSSDVGPKTTDEVLTFLRGKAKDSRFLPDEVVPALRTYLSDRLADGITPITAERGKLTIFLMVGVNGVGKTTTTGKIAAKFRLNDYKVLLAAADTFRAAAVDQLQIWGNRAGVDVIRHAEGGDAAAVVFDAIQAAKARGIEALIVDTAGRLHTKHNLMEELRKIRRIVEREAPDAIVESLLILDATTGQNGLRQAEVFGQATPLTGVILTKLDGTAKGGVIFGIKETLGLPIRLLGVGEGIEDLREFDPSLFVDALFATTENAA